MTVFADGGGHPNDGVPAMPWKETSPKMEKIAFLAAWRSNEESKAELCRRFGISRKTGYKLWERWREEEEGALCERSRAPRSCPHALPDAVRQALVELRREHPTWGPKKLRAFLLRRDPATSWPALSTIGDLLDREGLVEEARRIRRRACPIAALPPLGPHHVWCADYKGWFPTTNGTRCDPLTVTDSYSRMLLLCAALTQPIPTEKVIGCFTMIMRRHGMPLFLKTDNGPPFASVGLGLTRFACWLIQRGVSPRRIPPGKPQQNGQHEYMHRVLKAETTRPHPAASLAGQQQRFDEFQRKYNEERPHEALGMATPASRYSPSPRPFPEKIADPEYPEGATVHRVQKDGYLWWRHQYHFLSTALSGEWVRLVEHNEEPVLSVIYYQELVGRLDVGSGRILPPDPGALPQTPEFDALRSKHGAKKQGDEPP